MSDHFFRFVTIENFRGIKFLTIPDLARVNLFVGENCCGKTSVLESVFLLLGIGNPGLMATIQNNRFLVLSQGSDMREFFYNRNHEQGLKLSCVQKVGERNLEVLPLYGNLQRKQTGEIATVPHGNGDVEHLSFGMGVAETGQSLIGLGYQFDVTDSVTGESMTYSAGTYLPEIGSPNMKSFTDKNYNEPLRDNCLFRGRMGYDANNVDRVLNEKKKDFLLDSLRFVDPKITDIRAGVQGLVSVDIGLDSFIPVNLLGDGIMNMLSISAGINMVTNGALMIDEIENGLHVTALEQVWKIILDRSKKSNAQIFVTTHSEDVIKSLRNVLGEDLFSDAIACYRLVKFPDDVVRAYRYSGEQLGIALDSHTDIRV